MEIQKYKTLLRTTKHILKHQKEKEVLKGESFNVFSILKMETSENLTHSAFLVALLNPNGTHLKGSIFLELFLKTINNTTIDLSSVQVKTEHDIGRVDNENKKGGRIDIYIWDKKGNTITIENKINAGDQKCQVERYCNYNKEKNVVYYLTLDRKEPNKESKGALVSGVDFYSISYGSEIIDWLNLCLREAVDAPILRESIRQYIILLKKLTNTMDKQEEKELLDLIMNNYEASMFLANNVNKTIAGYNDKLRLKIFESLKEKISSDYLIDLGNSPEYANSQIWVRLKGYQEDKLIFGIQNFSSYVDKTFGNDIFIGVFIMNGKYLVEYDDFQNKKSSYWCGVEKFNNYKGYEVNLLNSILLNKLYNSVEFYDGFVNHIVFETINYVERYKERMIKLLKENTNIIVTETQRE